MVGRLKPGGLLGAGLALALVVCVGIDPVVAARPQAPGQRTARTARTSLSAVPSDPLQASPIRLPVVVVAAGTPTVRELVGQRFIVAMNGTSPSSSLLGRVRRGEIGGVILFGANIVRPDQLRRLTSTLQQAALEARHPPLLIATDQEGGRVRRLPWAGPTPSTTELGLMGAERIRAEAIAAGRALRRAGVNVDLAPVGDVPAPGSFMALEQRTFASSPATITEATVAFVQGLEEARVAAVVKAFPRDRPGDPQHRSLRRGDRGNVG